MELKGQAALEFIITYSWALIVISLFVVTVLLLSDVRPPVAYLQSSCSIQPLLPCSETLLSYNSVNPLQYYIIFNNQLGSIIYFPPNSLNVSYSSVGNTGTSYYYGNCTPNFASEGATVLCTANVGGNTKPKIGTQLVINFVLNYNFCNSASKANCAPGLYRSSGYSIQDVAPSNIRLNNVTFIGRPPGGTVLVNGVTYFNDTSAFLPSGNYVIYAQPASGTHFQTWSIVSSGSSIVSLTSQNTTLVLSSNAVVTAQSH